MLTLSISFAAVACAHSQFPNLSGVQDADGSQRLAYALPLALGAGLHGNSTPPLNHPTRLEIYTFVKNNPGVHFRGICDGLVLSVGVVQYHLGVLEQAGLVTVYVDGQNKRYFETKTYNASEVTLISLLRHETTAKILTILSQNGAVLHRDIAQNLGVTSQALTWQMNQLKKTGLINAEKEGVNVKYSLSEKNATAIKLILDLASDSRT
jgi:predicted transcriptional regulator